MTTSPTQRRPLAKLALISVASLGLIGGSVAVAGPASASGYDPKHDKKVVCWVDAKDVDHKERNYGHYSDKNNKKAVVKFEFKIWCNKKANVKFEHWIYQKNQKGNLKEIEHRGPKVITVREGKKYEDHTKAEVKDHGRKGGHEYVFHVVKIKYDEKDDKKHEYKVTKSDWGRGTVKFY
jgi:hypothetical protein